VNLNVEKNDIIEKSKIPGAALAGASIATFEGATNDRIKDLE